MDLVPPPTRMAEDRFNSGVGRVSQPGPGRRVDGRHVKAAPRRVVSDCVHALGREEEGTGALCGVEMGALPCPRRVVDSLHFEGGVVRCVPRNGERHVGGACDVGGEANTAAGGAGEAGLDPGRPAATHRNERGHNGGVGVALARLMHAMRAITETRISRVAGVRSGEGKSHCLARPPCSASSAYRDRMPRSKWKFGTCWCHAGREGGMGLAASHSCAGTRQLG